MHAAPPVSVQGTGGRCWRAARALLPALAAGAFGAWALGHLELPAAFAIPAALAVGALAWRRARAETAVLAWDGQAWTVDGLPAAVQVMVDFDSWLLLQCRPVGAAGGVRWLAFSSTDAGAQWPLLRAALYAPAPAAEGSAAQPADV